MSELRSGRRRCYTLGQQIKLLSKLGKHKKVIKLMKKPSNVRRLITEIRNKTQIYSEREAAGIYERQKKQQYLQRYLTMTSFPVFLKSLAEVEDYSKMNGAQLEKNTFYGALLSGSIFSDQWFAANSHRLTNSAEDEHFVINETMHTVFVFDEIFDHPFATEFNAHFIHYAGFVFKANLDYFKMSMFRPSNFATTCSSIPFLCGILKILHDTSPCYCDVTDIFPRADDYLLFMDNNQRVETISNSNAADLIDDTPREVYAPMMYYGDAFLFSLPYAAYMLNMHTTSRYRRYIETLLIKNHSSTLPLIGEFCKVMLKQEADPESAGYLRHLPKNIIFAIYDYITALEKTGRLEDRLIENPKGTIRLLNFIYSLFSVSGIANDVLYRTIEFLMDVLYPALTNKNILLSADFLNSILKHQVTKRAVQLLKEIQKNDTYKYRYLFVAFFIHVIFTVQTPAQLKENHHLTEKDVTLVFLVICQGIQCTDINTRVLTRLAEKCVFTYNAILEAYDLSNSLIILNSLAKVIVFVLKELKNKTVHLELTRDIDKLSTGMLELLALRPRILLECVLVLEKKTTDLKIFGDLEPVAAAMVARLAELDKNQEIDEQFYDPLTAQLMQKPVRLPSSNMIVCEKTIMTHFLTQKNDPYDRTPLKKKDLLPAPAGMEEEIQALWNKVLNI